MDIAEFPTRLLVRQDVLESDHLARQLRDVLLGGVDHGQPFLEVAHGLGRLTCRLGEGLRHPAGDFVEAPLEDFGELPFLRLQAFGDLVLGRRLAFRQLREPPAELGEAGGVRARPGAAQDQHGGQPADQRRACDHQGEACFHVFAPRTGGSEAKHGGLSLPRPRLVRTGR